MKPSKLTPELRAQVVKLIEGGASLEAVCKSAGIAYSTHRVWMLRGEAEAVRLEKPSTRVRQTEKPYLEYMEAIKKARARVEVELVSLIMESARGGGEVKRREVRKYYRGVDGKQGPLRETLTEVSTQPPQWTAAAWLLERKFGYVKTDEVKLETILQQRMDETIAVLRDNISPEALEEFKLFLERYNVQQEQGDKVLN